MLVPMTHLAAAAFVKHSGANSVCENIIEGSTAYDDEFWEWIEDQGGIVTGEEDYIEINGAKVEPDDPFLQWLKEQDWEVVENKDNRNSETIKETSENNRQKRQEWIESFYSKDPSAFLIVNEEEAFKKLSDSIVAGISDNYQKVYAIHDWVCSNIYYDFPAANDTSEYIYIMGGNKISLRPDEFAEYESLSELDRLMKYKRGVCGYYAERFYNFQT